MYNKDYNTNQNNLHFDRILLNISWKVNSVNEPAFPQFLRLAVLWKAVQFLSRHFVRHRCLLGICDIYLTTLFRLIEPVAFDDLWDLVRRNLDL